MGGKSPTKGQKTCDHAPIARRQERSSHRGVCGGASSRFVGSRRGHFGISVWRFGRTDEGRNPRRNLCRHVPRRRPHAGNFCPLLFSRFGHVTSGQEFCSCTPADLTNYAKTHHVTESFPSPD